MNRKDIDDIIEDLVKKIKNGVTNFTIENNCKTEKLIWLGNNEYVYRARAREEIIEIKLSFNIIDKEVSYTYKRGGGVLG
jgi:hypothetical protein